MGAEVILSAGAQLALDKGTAEARARANSEIDSLVQSGLNEMGLGDVDIVITIDDISPEGVRDAAVNGGLAYAEDALQAETGLPIRIPRKLSLNELQQTLGFAIPTNFWEAVDLALYASGQAIAAGVTSLLVGAGVGSVVPGLGTIVGVGVAIGINALKTAFAEEPRRRVARTCDTFIGCRTIAPEQTPIAVFIDGMYFVTSLSSQIVEEIRVRGYCESEYNAGCMSQWNRLIGDASELSIGTANRMTRPEINEVLPSLERAPTAYIVFDPASSTIKSYPYPPATARVLEELRARDRELMNIDSGITVLNNLNYEGVRSLQMTLLDEVDKAAVAVQASANGVRPEAIFQANANELLRMQRGFEAASTRQLQLGIQPGPPPVSPSVAARSEALMNAAPILSACSKLYDDWARIEPHRAMCVDGATKSELIGICMQAGAGRITLEQMTAQADAVVNAACRRHNRGQFWAAFQYGAALGLNPVARAVATRA